MRAAWIEDGRVTLREVPEAIAAKGEALLQPLLVGICGTDLELLAGYKGFVGIPGHELVARVLEHPDPELIGRRVSASINIGCGDCQTCRQRGAEHCRARKVLGILDRPGALAERLAIPAELLVPIPDGLASDVAVFAEPVAAALRILEQVELSRRRVLLIGAGRLGQLIARALATTGHQFLVVARHLRQRELLENAGISWIEESDVSADAFDLVIDSSGHPSGLELARRALRPLGTLVLKSTIATATVLDPTWIVVDEIQVIGSRCGDVAGAVESLASGTIDTAGLIDHRFELGAIETAMQVAALPGALKTLISIEA